MARRKTLHRRDVVFNWEFAKDPATAAVTIGRFRDLTVRRSTILPYASCSTNQPRSGPMPLSANSAPSFQNICLPTTRVPSLATPEQPEANRYRPYKFVEFKPGDIVRGELNPDYHMPNRPCFDSIEMKGGGDAVSAARAVIQTGEYDFAWNIQVEDEVLLRMENGGKGKTIYRWVPILRPSSLT